jgi:hypothetical protein
MQARQSSAALRHHPSLIGLIFDTTAFLAMMTCAVLATRAVGEIL